MGLRRLTHLTDLSRQGFWLKIRCPCGHTAKMDPAKLLESLSRRNASVMLSRLHERMACGKCGGKEFAVEHCFAPEAWSGKT